MVKDRCPVTRRAAASAVKWDAGRVPDDQCWIWLQRINKANASISQATRPDDRIRIEHRLGKGETPGLRTSIKSRMSQKGRARASSNDPETMVSKWARSQAGVGREMNGFGNENSGTFTRSVALPIKDYPSSPLAPVRSGIRDVLP
jgi:hypothetical protein